MKRLFKIAVVLVVLFMCLLGAASLALHFLLPPQKAKELVLKQLTEHLRREVRIGDVTIGILSGLSLSNLEISEAPNFSKGTFLSSERFTLKVSLIPLIFRKIVIREFALRQPVITLIRNADGKTFNFSDLAGSPAPAPPVGAKAGMVPSAAPQASLLAKTTSPSPETPFLLLVSQGDIVGGSVKFIDQSPASQSAELTQINLKVRNVSLVAPFNIQMSLKVKSKGTEVALHLVGDGEIPSGSVKIKTFSVVSGGSTIEMSGVAKQVRSAHPVADLKLEIKEFDLESLRPFVAWPSALQISGPITGSATLKGDDQDMSVAVGLDATKAAVVYTPQFNKPEKTPMTFSLHAVLKGLQTLEVHDAAAGLGSLKLSAHGSVEGVRTPQPVASLHFETNDFSAAEFSRLLPGTVPSTAQVGGTAKISADISGTSLSSGIKAKVDATDLSLVIPNELTKPAGLPLEVSVIGDLLQPHRSEKTANFQSLEGSFASLKWNGNGSFALHGTSQEVSLALKTNSFAIHDLAILVPVLAPYKPSGTAVANIHVKGAATSPQVSGTVVVQNVSARYEQSELNGIGTTATFTSQDINIPKITGKLNGSEFSMNIVGHELQTHPAITLDGNFAVLDLDKLLPPPEAALGPTFLGSWVTTAEAGPLQTGTAMLPLKTSGRIVVAKVKHSLYQAQNLDFKWNLSDVTSDLSRVNGSAVLRQGAGQLQNIEKLSSQSKAAKIALFPIQVLQKLAQSPLLKQAHLPTLQSIPFNGIKGDYSFHSGVMEIQSFDLMGRDLDLQTQGSVGLAGLQPLNLKVKTSLSAEMVGRSMASLLQDASGRVIINFSVGGTMADPQIHVDVQEVGRKAIQQIGTQLLKGLAQPSNTSNGSSSNNSDNGQQNPAGQFQKALKDIFH